MKYVFKNLTIAVTGDFGERRGVDKMRQWVQVNGGRFVYEISPNVTHLICSKEHLQKDKAIVRQARDLKTVKIVSFDWLEDSLIAMRVKNEREYLMGIRVKAAAQTKEKKKMLRKGNVKKGMEKFEKACKEFVQDMNTDGYEIYRDPCDSFSYDLTLARANLLTNKNERYQLKVCPTSHTPPSTPLPHLRIPPCIPASSLTSYPYFINPPCPIISTPIFPISPLPSAARACLASPRAQRLQLYVSHGTPKMFACYVKYSAPNVTSTIEVLAPRGSSWELTWGAFEAFFKLKTRKEWSMRFWKWERGGPANAFVYTPPRGGEPRGMFLEV